MSVFNFVPKGDQWKVIRKGVTIGIIHDSPRGLLLTIEGAGLDATEVQAIEVFMSSIKAANRHLTR